MKRINLLLIPTLITALFPSLLFAGVSQSQSFRLSVTLPAVVGQNVFPQGQSIGSPDLKSKQDIITEETLVDDKRVVLQTIVLK